MLGPWDDAVFRWINSGWKNPVGDEVFRFFSLAIELPVFIVVLVAVVVAHVIAGGKWRSGALLSLLAFPLANLICDQLKNGFYAARPCIDLYGVRLLLYYNGEVFWLDSSGTSSAHAANMAAIATAMTFETKAWGIPWIVIALLTGVSRVYTGVHYPSQVLLGWLVGFGSGAVVCLGWRMIRKKRGQPPVHVATD